MENRELCLTRQYRFSAAHYLTSPYLTNEENISLYGKCGQETGHGHNYTLKVTVKGLPSPDTGMIVDHSELDSIIRENVLKRLDHKNLNITYNEIGVLTSENLIREIWGWLTPFFNTTPLYKLELNETDKNSFEYYGDKERSSGNSF